MSALDNMEENPYLALRAVKIARNNELLKKLGLATTLSSNRTPQHTENGARRATSKRRAETKHPTRRSTRHRRDSLDEKESPLVSLENIPQPPSRRQLKIADLNENQNLTRTKTRSYVFAANSVRRFEISVSHIVDLFLGRPMAKTGKATVVQNTLDGANASFNKFSGVQEWGNDAIYLWVNIDDSTRNDFPQKGRQITWFGGSRMYDDTPVIQKLLRLGRESEDIDTTTDDKMQKKSDSRNGIVLWCRHYNPATKTYHPYTCLGRLSYESHVPESYPLELVWNLVDYDRLIQHEDHAVRAQFQEIINSRI